MRCEGAGCFEGFEFCKFFLEMRWVALGELFVAAILGFSLACDASVRACVLKVMVGRAIETTPERLRARGEESECFARALPFFMAFAFSALR